MRALFYLINLIFIRIYKSWCHAGIKKRLLEKIATVYFIGNCGIQFLKFFLEQIGLFLFIKPVIILLLLTSLYIKINFIILLVS
ncbi:hypothetical protein EG359_04585 [Chryseobacterium joostei]|uniref:Uncharacterized protein n=1 Tax=Chryseobacterium joostei TaxID=112234 RepID=A0ABN5S807_9FLAO|nr:hypothetical protein EG359_04585 [Chryseobacterium joostei]